MGLHGYCTWGLLILLTTRGAETLSQARVHQRGTLLSSSNVGPYAGCVSSIVGIKFSNVGCPSL